MRPRHALLVLAMLSPSCTPSTPGPQWAHVNEHTPSALIDIDAHDPALAVDTTGRVALTWVVRDTSGADVWFALSRDGGAHFSSPVRVNSRQGRVSSYSESRPVVALAAAGRVLLAWASQRDSLPAADDIVVRTSEDDGAHFGPEVVLNSDHLDPH